MNGLIQDLRFAIRAFALNPGFTAAAVLSLALGIGANTAIFSVASALLLRPAALPGRRPAGHPLEPLARASASPKTGSPPRSISTSSTAISGFEQLAIAIGGNYNLTGDGEPERIGTLRVSSNLLPMLGVASGARPAVRRRRRPARPPRHGPPEPWHLDAPLRRRSRGARPLADAQRPAVSRSSACCRRRSRCRAR